MFYKRKSSIVFALICMLFLSSCLATRYKALAPDSPYMVQPQEALVVVGNVSVYPIKCIHQSEPSSTYKVDRPFDTVYVIPVPVGNSFKIDEIQSLSGGYAKFKNTKNMEIKKRGIYYYGTLSGRDNSVRLSYKVNPIPIRKLEDSYSKQMEQPGLTPVNFSW